MSPNFKKYLVLITGLIGLAIYVLMESSNKGDLRIFLMASSDMPDQVNIFEKKYIDGYHYFYSTLFAMIIFPLTFLPEQLSNAIWIILNLFFVYQIFLIIKNLLPLFNLTKKQLMFLRVCGFLFSLRFIYENIHSLQMTIVILYLTLQGLQWIFANKTIPGSLLLALGINIKLLPIVFIPYLIYRGFFKAASLSVLFYLLMLFTPGIIIGWEYNLSLLKTWAHLINPFNATHILDTEERSFHGLSTLLATLLVENANDVYALPLKRNIADISIANLSLILNLVRLTLIGFTLYFLRSFPFKKPSGFIHRFREISYLLLVIPLIFPHQQHYAFLFICPAFVFCLHYLITNKNKLSLIKQRCIAISLTFIYFICNLKMILGAFNNYYEHYKILTYGAMLLIAILAICNPIEKENPIEAA